jgi:hypothetical protein
MMSRIFWRNEPTKIAYYDFLESVDDPLDFARGWLAMNSPDDAVQLLARRLRRDARSLYRRPSDDPFEDAMVRAAMRLISWRQVAFRILERARALDAKPLQGRGDDDKESESA